MHLKRNQLFALIILFIFLGSSAAFALLNVIPIQQPKQQLVFDQPLSNADEAKFLQQNKVVMKYFWSDNCTDCPATEATVKQLFQDFGGALVVESIDVDRWPEAATELDVTTVPTIYLKGYTIERITTDITYDGTYRTICGLFFNQIEACASVS